MEAAFASDISLIIAASSGDEDAFRALYERHRTSVFRLAWRLTGSEGVAEDITQECFLALLDGAAYDSGQAALRTYLFGVVRHLAGRRMRRAERETDEVDEASDAPDALDGLLAAERSAIVERAVRRLPMLQREALILFEYEDLSMEQIAVVTGADVGAVKARLHRARETLRQQLSGLMPRGSDRGVGHDRR